MTAIPLTRRGPRSRLARREATWGLIFIAPWIVGFIAFTLLPMAATFVFTFTNISLDQKAPLSFVGLSNYQNLATHPQVGELLAGEVAKVNASLPEAQRIQRFLLL